MSAIKQLTSKVSGWSLTNQQKLDSIVKAIGTLSESGNQIKLKTGRTVPVWIKTKNMSLGGRLTIHFKNIDVKPIQDLLDKAKLPFILSFIPTDDITEITAGAMVLDRKKAIAKLEKVVAAPYKLSVKDLNLRMFLELKILATCLKTLDVGTTISDTCDDVLRYKYNNAADMLSDVQTVVSYFGGDCFKQIGKKILEDLKESLVPETDNGFPKKRLS